MINILKVRNNDPKKNKLNVAFIGGLGLLTKEDEKAISAFIKSSEEKRQKQKTGQKTRPPTQA